MRLEAVSLRYFKCYEATQHIPLLFNNQHFVGFIGENGVGKSAILEALHSFFTGQDWIRNKTGRKGEATCGVAPVISLAEKELNEAFEAEEVVILKRHSKSLKASLDWLDASDMVVYASCLLLQTGDIKLFDGNQQVGEDDLAKKLREFILKSFKYVYIGAEVDIDSGTEINSKTIEFIKGSGVVEEVNRALSSVRIDASGQEKSISQIINEAVIKYLDESVIKKLQEVDTSYDYKNLKTGVVSKLTEKHLSELAAQALFGTRELTKKIKGKHIGISDMSSGQRRKAFLDFICVMISNLSEDDRRHIILAIDEPEISVDAGSRIQQFDKLKKLSEAGASVVFTTHWYGWIAQLIGGNAVVIKETEEGRHLLRSSIQDFLDTDLHKKAPYEMRMMFDFLSSLGTWAESEPGKKFVVCEGDADKRYIQQAFPEYKIMPLRGAEKVVRLFKVFSDYYIRVSDKPKNIAFLIDTDPEKASVFESAKGESMKRISRDGTGAIKIVSNNENYSEKCEIEDLLGPVALLSALKGASDILSEQSHKDFINNLIIKYQDQTGPRAFGMDEVQKQNFKSLFKGEFKKRVSEKYEPSEDELSVFKQLLVLD